MKANYKTNERIIEGKKRAKKYAEFAAQNNLEIDEWQKVPEGTDMNTGMTVYDMAKQGAAQAPALTEEGCAKLKQEIANFVKNNRDDYYMLLNNDLHDYTLFHVNAPTGPVQGPPQYEKIAEEVYLCMIERGTLVEYEVTDGAVELWITDPDKQPYVYYFFKYGTAVIEI